MVIEVIPKEKIKKFSWQDFIFYLFLVIFFLFFLSYLGLIFYQKKLENKRLEVEKALARTEAEKKLEEEIFIYKKKIDDFLKIVSNRYSVLNIFYFLEKNTHPKVWFSNFDFNLKNNSLSLLGQAESPEVMEQQIIILKNEKMVKDLILSDVSITSGGSVEFEIKIIFDPQFLIL